MPTATVMDSSSSFKLQAEIGRENIIIISLSLSFRFNGHFPGEPGSAVPIEAKGDVGGGDNWTTGGAVSRAKLQPNHHHQQTNIQFFYRPDALPVTQPTVSKH